ncbi:hypothetical protein SGPA1_80033 [Streptomyces misionensis JCM 4497]
MIRAAPAPGRRAAPAPRSRSEFSRNLGYPTHQEKPRAQSPRPPAHTPTTRAPGLRCLRGFVKILIQDAERAL